MANDLGRTIPGWAPLLVAIVFLSLPSAGRADEKVCDATRKGACGPGQYCLKTPKACQSESAKGVCVSRPRVCPQIFQPVCGCDGQTYPNACVAGSRGVSIAHSGRCAAPAKEM